MRSFCLNEIKIQGKYICSRLNVPMSTLEQNPFYIVVTACYPNPSVERIVIDTVWSGDIHASFLSKKYTRLTELIFTQKGNITALLDLPPTLKVLHCSNQRLTEIPSNISSVSDLNLSHNHIQSTQGIEQCKLLEKLNLSNNRLSGRIDQLPDTLSELNISHNSISELHIADLSRLHVLHTDNNSPDLCIYGAKEHWTPTVSANHMQGGARSQMSFADALATFRKLNKTQQTRQNNCAYCAEPDHKLQFRTEIDSNRNRIIHAECPQFRASLFMGRSEYIKSACRSMEKEQVRMHRQQKAHELNALFQYAPAEQIRQAISRDKVIADQINQQTAKCQSQLRDIYVYDNPEKRHASQEIVSGLTRQRAEMPRDESYPDSVKTWVRESVDAAQRRKDAIYPPTTIRWTHINVIESDTPDQLRTVPSFCMYSTMKDPTQIMVSLGGNPRVLHWGVPNVN